MRHVVPGFQHRPGIHCGSTAMADALRTVGVDLTEEMALGLGAGPSFLALEGPHMSPSRVFVGRSVSFEHDLCTRLGVPFDEAPVAGFDHAWAKIRADLDAGRVVLALSDLKFLPYWNSSTHFNGHRILIAGYDDETRSALVADSHFPGLVEVSLGALAQSLESDAAPVMTRDCYFGSLGTPEKKLDLRTLAREAVHANAASMLDPSDFMGLGGIERLAATIGSWGDAADATWCARFASQIIEKRGTGGGLFRRMYSRFLQQAGIDLLVPLALEAARSWTAFAEALKAVTTRNDGVFSTLTGPARVVLLAERALWTAARGV